MTKRYWTFLLPCLFVIFALSVLVRLSPPEEVLSETDIVPFLKKNVIWQQDQEILVDGCELRLSIQTGTTCLIPSHRKSVDRVFNFSEFSSSKRIPSVQGTTRFELKLDAEAVSALDKARTIMTEPSGLEVKDRFDNASRYLIGQMSSGLVAHDCSGRSPSGFGVNNHMDLRVKNEAADKIESWVSSKLTQCSKSR